MKRKCLRRNKWQQWIVSAITGLLRRRRQFRVQRVNLLGDESEGTIALPRRSSSKSICRHRCLKKKEITDRWCWPATPQLLSSSTPRGLTGLRVTSLSYSLRAQRKLRRVSPMSSSNTTQEPSSQPIYQMLRASNFTITKKQARC